MESHAEIVKQLESNSSSILSFEDLQDYENLAAHLALSARSANLQSDEIKTLLSYIATIVHNSESSQKLSEDQLTKLTQYLNILKASACVQQERKNRNDVTTLLQNCNLNDLQNKLKNLDKQKTNLQIRLITQTLKREQLLTSFFSLRTSSIFSLLGATAISLFCVAGFLTPIPFFPLACGLFLLFLISSCVLIKRELADPLFYKIKLDEIEGEILTVKQNIGLVEKYTKGYENTEAIQEIATSLLKYKQQINNVPSSCVETPTKSTTVQPTFTAPPSEIVDPNKFYIAPNL